MIVAPVLTLGLVAIVPTFGRAQSTSLPDKGQKITVTGCFTQGVIGHDPDERFVLAKPIVGTVPSVAEATCMASSTDQMVKLQDLHGPRLGSAQMGRWLTIYGRLESNNRKDGLREIHVKSFSLVPVVIPPPAVAVITPAPEPAPAVETPPPAPQVAEAAPAPMPEPAPVATSGVRKHLPKTATSVPFFGLIGFLSIAGGLMLHLFTKRTVEQA